MLQEVRQRAAYGLRPEAHAWVELPDTFHSKLELMARVEAVLRRRRLPLKAAGPRIQRQLFDVESHVFIGKLVVMLQSRDATAPPADWAKTGRTSKDSIGPAGTLGGVLLLVVAASALLISALLLMLLSLVWTMSRSGITGGALAMLIVTGLGLSTPPLVLMTVAAAPGE